MKLVLLPGLDGTGILFKPFIEALPDTIEPLVISYPANAKLSYGELTEFVISRLPQEKFILVGESFSGNIAYQVALRKPTHLQSVIFVATFIENPRPFLIGFHSFLSFLSLNHIVLALMPSFIIRPILFGFPANIQMNNLLKQTMEQISPHVLACRLHEISKLTQAHQPCKIRATYIQATGDKLIPARCVENFKKVFTDINIFQIQGSHCILQINPLACAEIVVNETRQQPAL